MLEKIKKDVISNVKIPQQTYASFVASMTILIASFWTIYISPVLLKFERNEMPFRLEPEETAWIVSIMDFGNFVSPIPAGIIMNLWGRKMTLIIAAIIYLMASFCALIASSGEYLFMARFLAGIGKGFSFTVSPLYVAEISSKSIRGALSSTFYAFFCTGTIFASTIGPYVSFQTLNYISAGLPILFILMIAPLPESPYYYLMKAKNEKAEKSLNWFRNISTKEHKFVTNDEFREIKLSLIRDSKHEGTFAELLSNVMYRKALLIVTMVGLAQRFGGISYMLSYGASDLPRSGIGRLIGRRECLALFSVASLVANIVSGLVLDNIGRKPILLLSTISTSMCLFVSAVYFTVRHEFRDPDYYWIPYSVVIFYSISFTAGLGVIPATFQGELFPSEIKRHASAVVVMILSLGSFLVNLTHDTLTKYCGIAGNYYLAAGCTLYFAIWSYFYVFETKGKTLIEIQDQLSRSVSRASLKDSKNPSTSKLQYSSLNRFSLTNIASGNKSNVLESITERRTYSPQTNFSNEQNSNEETLSGKFYLQEFKSTSLSTSERSLDSKGESIPEKYNIF